MFLCYQNELLTLNLNNIVLPDFNIQSPKIVIIHLFFIIINLSFYPKSNAIISYFFNYGIPII